MNYVSAQVLRSCYSVSCCVSDGYAKLRERHSSEERCIDSDGDHDAKNKKDAGADATPSKQESASKSTSSKPSESLFGAPGRLIQRALDHSSRYQQFADVDSDDLDKEVVSAAAGGASGVTSGGQPVANGSGPPQAPPLADDTSEDPESLDAERYQRKKDYSYQELDDEFGSKRSAKPSSDYNIYNADGDSSEDPSKSHDDFDVGDRCPPKQSMLSKVVNAKSQIQSQPQSHDRIIGHQYGVKPLIDDDELSDSELNNQSQTLSNPFSNSSSRGSSAMSASSAIFMQNSPAMSPQSQNSEDSAINVADPFINVPFKKKQQQQQQASKKKHKLMKSPLTKQEGDEAFSNAPFHPTKTISPQDVVMGTTYVNPAADEDIFRNAPFRGSKHSSKAATPSSTTISPSNIVDMRSPSQSPEGVVTSVVPPSISRDNIFTQQQQQQQLAPPMSPGQIDLFGSGNFADMTFGEVQQAQAHAHYAQVQGHPQQQRPASQPQYTTSASPAPVPFQSRMPAKGSSLSHSRSPVDAQQDLFGAQPFGGQVLTEMSPTENSRPIDAEYQPLGGSKKHTPAKGRKGRMRRRSSDSCSSGSDGRPSPRSTKKDKYYSKSTDMLHDENLEVLIGDGNHGSLKKTKHKSSKKEKSRHASGSEKKRHQSGGHVTSHVSLNVSQSGETAFANLSFCDDLDGDKAGVTMMMDEGEMMDSFHQKSESHSNLNLEPPPALNPSNTSNNAEEKSQTLPRATNMKKHRVLPSTPDTEPFTVKKKVGLFK